MNPPSNVTDKHGFPIPRGFDDRPARRAELSPRVHRWSRLVLGLMLAVLVGAIVFRSGLLDAGRARMAAMYLDRAERKYDANDEAGAIDDLGSAIRWLPAGAPELAPLYAERGKWRAKAVRDGDPERLQAGLDDLNTALEINAGYFGAYTVRATIYQRLGKHEQAIADLNAAVALLDGASLEKQHASVYYNDRAYGLAIAYAAAHGEQAAAGKADASLVQALADIDLAMRYRPGRSAHYLDTRGYILYLMGDAAEALADLDQALQTGHQEQQTDLEQLSLRGASPGMLVRAHRHWDETLSVLYYHRSLAHEKLGHADLALADRQRAEKLGYNPTAGVY